MRELTFTFDKEANGYLSEAMTIEDEIVVRIELSSCAPVLTLKQEPDGGWGNYGQPPEDHEGYEITIRPTEKMTIKLASPVEVLDCKVM